MKHQQFILDQIKDKPKFAIWATPGLGKTYMAFHDWYHSDSKDLIICAPPSLLTNWEEEFNKMEFNDDNIVVHKLNKTTKKSAETINNRDTTKRNVFLVSYNSMWRTGLDITLLSLDKNTCVAFDEAHKVKNRKSSQSKFSIKLSKRYKRIRLLTGTPRSISNEDYYIYCKLLDIDDIRVKTVKLFTDNFLMTNQGFTSTARFQIIVGDKNIDILMEIMSPYNIYMNEKQAGIILPERIDKTIFVDYSYEAKKAMKDRTYKEWTLNTSGARFMANRTSSSDFLYGRDMYDNQVVVHFPKMPKMEAFRDIMESIGDHQVMVFTNFIEEIDLVKEVAKKLGKTTSTVSAAKQDTSGDIVFMNYGDGALGQNYQFIKYVIYYSPTINGASFIQSKKRNHRVGQDETTYFFSLIAKGSIEEKILSKIEKNEIYTEKNYEEDYENE